MAGAVSIGGAVAGPAYYPPATQSPKCPIDVCPDTSGSVSVGYATDYIFRGVRLTEDNLWADINYTFDNCFLPVTIGATHITGLSSRGTGLGSFVGAVPVTDGDQTDLYASVELPSVMGFGVNLNYHHYLYSNQRGPSGAAGAWGDSHGALSLSIAREILCGLVLSYESTYDFQVPGNFPNAFSGGDDGGAWIHTIDLTKNFRVSDNVGLELSGGVLYTDNVWHSNWTNLDGSPDRARSSGWNNYYLRAAMPISLSPCATLVPYVGYNGTPDGWIADGVDGDFLNGSNGNDIFHGGFSVEIKF